MRHAGRTLGLLVGLIGIGVMWFATQVADEGDVGRRQDPASSLRNILAYLTSRNEVGVILDLLLEDSTA
jgi:hypothetical protein